MKSVTLSDGFVIEVDEERLDNAELVDALSDLVDSENPLALSRVMTLSLGKETKKKLYDHLRNEAGRVPNEAASRAIFEIFTGVGAKN